MSYSTDMVELIPVAKHFLASRDSFNATARHWAQAYAQAPGKKSGKDGAASDAELAGLSEESVSKFADMGFERPKVIATLKRLNYRGNNVSNINENTVSTSFGVGLGADIAGHRGAAQVDNLMCRGRRRLCTFLHESMG